MVNRLSLDNIKRAIRDIPDFPKSGIIFKDLTTVFKQPHLLKEISETYVDYYRDKGITKVAGIESRGFVMGSVLALELNAGFVPIRKPGKLPAGVYSAKYELEYGTDTIEIHKDAINPDDVVLLHDDLLATGGTAAAAVELIRLSEARKIYISFIVELEFLKGIDKLDKDIDILSLVSY